MQMVNTLGLVEYSVAADVTQSATVPQFMYRIGSSSTFISADVIAEIILQSGVLSFFSSV